MTGSLELALAKVAELGQFCERAGARRLEIERELGVTVGVETRGHPELQELNERQTDLHREADALSPFLIRANLTRLGVADLVVTGAFEGDGTRRPEQVGLLLSDLCGTGASGLLERIGFPSGFAGPYTVLVESEVRRIGFIDTDRLFRYEAAPDIRTFLAWALATDGGRVRLLDEIDLGAVERELIDITKAIERVEDILVAKAAFIERLKQLFVYGQTSRFVDGSSVALTWLRGMAMRQAHRHQ